MLGLASSAGSYAFTAASSYVFRPDASTSSPLSGSSANLPTQSRRNGRATSTTLQQTRNRAGHRRNTSSLPSSSPNRIGEKGKQRAAVNGIAEEEEQGVRSPGVGSDHGIPAEKSEGVLLVDVINKEDDLYRILGVTKKVKSEDIRKAFLGRSRICHPDKLPDYPAATPAFQRLSYAYETLSKPTSRRMYDLGGGRSFDPGVSRDQTTAMGDETLNGVLRNVFNEFLAGDFEMIRVFVAALNEGNPGLNLGDEAVDNLEGVFRRIREVLLSGQKYLRLIRFELIRLYQIQSDLRSLGYLDIIGRLRLTLALTRVTLEIPMVLDRAMRDEPAHPPPQPSAATATAVGSEKNDSPRSAATPNGTTSSGELQRRGLLGPRVKGVLVVACKVLEKGEKFGL